MVLLTFDTPLLLMALTALGVLELFCGYRIFRGLLLLMALLVGFSYGPNLYTFIFNVRPAQHTTLLIAVLMALLLTLAMRTMFWFVMFLAGAALGYMLGLAAFGQAVLSVLLIALSLGIVASVLERLLIVSLTALNGAWTVVSSLGFALGLSDTAPRLLPLADLRTLYEQLGFGALLSIILLTYLGSYIQLYNLQQRDARQHAQQEKHHESHEATVAT